MTNFKGIFPTLDDEGLDAIRSAVGRIDYDGSVASIRSGGSKVNGVRADKLGWVEGANNYKFTPTGGDVEQIQMNTKHPGAWWREWKENQLTDIAILQAIIDAGHHPS